MDTLFGMELPLLLKFAISFAIVIALIVVAAALYRWATRARGRLGRQSRLPRLAVVDSAAIDDRRNLVIIRRDNVEHLLLIGGTTDLLVEANISQIAVQPAREPETLPRAPAVSAPAWHPVPIERQAPPAPPPAPPKIEPHVEVTPQRTVREEPAIIPEAVVRPEPRIQTVPAFEAPPPPPAPSVASADFVPAPEPAPQPRAPVAAIPQDLDVNRQRHPTMPPPVIAEPPSQPAAPKIADRESPFTEGQNLSDMAQRLEAALRRPLAGQGARSQAMPTRPLTAPPRNGGGGSAAPAVRISPAEESQQAAPPVASPVNPVAPEDENGGYETLQREMASLLGRKPGSP
jgi:hypothetical protein